MNILLIEDNPADARLVREQLKDAPGKFILNTTETLGAGLEFVASKVVDVILLDMNLPDSNGLESLTRLQDRFPRLPVVILTSSNDEALGLEAVKQGAQDYLIKGQVESGLLRRALAYAIERKKTDEKLKGNEEFLKRLAELNPALIYVTDLAANRITYSSKPWPSFLGYDLREINDIESFQASVVDSGDIERMVASLEELKRANDDRIREIEISARDKTGRRRWFQVQYTIFKRDSDGRPIQSMSVARDISDRKEAERIKEEFVGMVSHELRTPLTVIIGALLTAQTEGIPEDQKTALILDASASAEAMAAIVENLLELSRHQSNRLKLEAERTDISGLARSVVQHVGTVSTVHHVSVDVGDSCSAVMVDRIRIERVVHNLVENAIKYSPNGGEVKISAHLENDQVIMGVSDQGIGISPGDKARLFQSFERLGQEHGHIPGLGLGLRVCRIIVEAHGGKIWVDSEPGKGSTFYFTLPLKRG